MQPVPKDALNEDGETALLLTAMVTGSEGGLHNTDEATIRDLAKAALDEVLDTALKGLAENNLRLHCFDMTIQFHAVQPGSKRQAHDAPQAGAQTH